MSPRPISLLVCALGGEGGGVLTDWLVNAAQRAGYPVQATSIPGVAQRTGATTYYIEVFPQRLDELGGRRPVFSLNPVPGALDVLVSSELLETARQAGNGLPSPDRTLVITSNARALTTNERMQLGDGRVDDDALVGLVQAASRAHHVFDMNAVAKESGTVVSAVMLGAIAGSGVFPFAREHYEAVVREGGGGAQASLRGFAKAFARVQAGTKAALAGHEGQRPPVEPGVTTGVPEAAASPPGVTRGWPAPVAEFATLGMERLIDYQGVWYARLYERRLQQVLEAERQADPHSSNDYATTREAARWLALWMAFDDIVRVADLKSRASRWARVKREVKAGDAELLRVWDHFKPGAPEFAALLPPSLAKRVVAWDARRATPWALPLKVGTHTLSGMAMLRLLANLKWLRPRGHRYAQEQSMIERWLAGVVDGTARDWALGHEVAQCGRLVKGYGTTNERGKENLLHVLDHLVPQGDAAAIRAAREAALADDAGKALDATLVQHGAPARPVKVQPLRFVRNAATKGKPA